MRHHQIANPRCLILCLSALIAVLAFSQPGRGDDLRQTDQYRRLKSSLDAVPAIDTHDHLPPSDKMSGLETTRGRGMTLFSLWSRSYFPGVHRVEPWPASGKFDDWWRVQQPNFVNARATSFYRYLLPAFQDLYGVDFDTITPEQAAKLNDQIFDNYRKKDWLEEVVTRRANIELMLVDPFWARLQFARSYRFTVPLLNVTTLMSASHPDRYQGFDSPYVYAAQHQLKTATFDDFLAVVDAIFADAVAHDCVCLKSTQAYSRTLNYENVPKERAAAVYGKSPKEATPQQQKDFEDFMFWHVCQLSAKYDLPFQVHTGQARIQGSNPMLLVDVIEANRATKFILFHGGYPWVGETAVIGMKERNVWIDSVWLPTLSQTVARRAYQEWLDAMPSDRIMWGADCLNAEGIYGSTVLTRQCLADALAEKVQRGELNEADAMRIGRQILRDNALQLFPKLKRVLWRKDVEAKVGMGASRATRVPGATPQFSPKPKPKSGAMPQAPAAK
ncbi:MAG: amidohydrolase, partial [Planctomycetia bacterium]|nr:amidohydrolase [Planctomycetia bacterium]